MTDMTHDFHAAAPADDAAIDAANRGRRKRLYLAFAASLALIGGGTYAYDALVASRHVSTNNAYVGADLAQVTPLVGGPVKEVLVQDSQQVRRGTVLVRLDDTDAKLAVARADAALAAAIRRVRGLVATDNGLSAQIAAREADERSADAEVSAAHATFEKARIDLGRREALAKTGAVSGDELTQVRNAFRTAEANLRAAEARRLQATASRFAATGSREANRALIADTTVDRHPDVLAARAALEQAKVDLERTVIRAPVDGIVSRRQVQVGQHVRPGTPLMLVVPIQAAYVDANFKEVQLARVKPGQPVTLTSDLYGDDVVFNGRVVGFSGGTGAAFAIVPAQNATGNWIKVVQRLPVRIALDPKQLAEHPLRVGLSMTADIEIDG